MKHIAKYNESYDSSINEDKLDYIKLVFADFLDGNSNIESVSGDNTEKRGRYLVSMDITVPTFMPEPGTDTHEIIEVSKILEKSKSGC